MQNTSDYECRVTGLEDYPLGCTVTDTATIFRLFSPKAHSIKVIIFEHYEDESGLSFEMEKDRDGIWNCMIQDHFNDQWYAYKIKGPDNSHFFLSTDEFIADPRSKHVTTRNHYLQYPKTKICTPGKFEWEGDTFVQQSDELVGNS